MKKRLSILFLTFCILFQTFGIQIGDNNDAVIGHSILKKKSENTSQNTQKSFFLILEENEESVEDDTNDNFLQQIYHQFSYFAALQKASFIAKVNKHFLLTSFIPKIHIFLVFRNIRI